VTGLVQEFIKGPPSLVDDSEAFQNFTAVDTAGQVAAVITPGGVLVTTIGTRRSRFLPDASADTVAFYGEQLLVQQSDGSLQIWNADATHLTRVIAGLASVVAGPVIDRAGLAIETGSDGSAAVIDLDSGVTLGTIYPPAGPRLRSVGIAMSAASTSLVTVTDTDNATGRGVLTDWQMSVSSWLRVACASAGHTLTAAEWQEYVGGSPPGHLACADGAPR
jgi:hypothetical protein